MESLYKDRDVRRFIRAGGFFAVCMIITGAFLYYVYMEDVKSLYLQQQAEAAGALLQAGIEPVEAARILGGEIRADMAEEGRQLMHSAGYEEPLSIRLIPPLRKIGFRWGLCFLIFGGLISLSSGGITYRLLAGQHRKLYEMEQSVRRFMEGDFEQRIPAEDEGDFALLSTAVNGSEKSEGFPPGYHNQYIPSAENTSCGVIYVSGYYPAGPGRRGDGKKICSKVCEGAGTDADADS